MYKVLLVDDEMYVRQGMRTLIDWQASGFEIGGEAENGAEALEWISLHQPDLVITDIRMPLLNGLDLVRKAAETEASRSSFIILSGYEDFKYAQEAVRSGVHDYILKPVDEDELTSSLLRLAGQLRQAPAPAANQPSLAPFVAVVLERMEEDDALAIRHAIGLFISALEADCASLEQVEKAIAQFIARATMAMQEMGIRVEGMTELALLLGWQARTQGWDALSERLAAFVLAGAARLKQARREKAHGRIHSIKRFIEEHYREDISLKSIAAHFYLNPVYMGQLFRKTYGIYFNEFLLGLRIREAKRLLRQTNMLVYEVASETGFNSPDYFVTQFEKLESKTPTEYRNQMTDDAIREEKVL
ncbi:response regulator [Paenibacillaceae bacterium]|nr:response regulator [Paenibacillaceae bacterium]